MFPFKCTKLLNIIYFSKTSEGGESIDAMIKMKGIETGTHERCNHATSSMNYADDSAQIGKSKKSFPLMIILTPLSEPEKTKTNQSEAFFR